MYISCISKHISITDIELMFFATMSTKISNSYLYLTHAHDQGSLVSRAKILYTKTIQTFLENDALYLLLTMYFCTHMYVHKNIAF